MSSSLARMMVPLILCYFLEFSAEAADPRKASATLIYRTNLGSSSEFSLTIQGNEVIVDGVKLSDMQKSQATPYLTRVLQASPSFTLKPCAAGEYVHTVAIGQKSRVEKGCLNSARFAELNRSFQMLKRPSF